jgi:lipid II isoglutaminyl synthase (glutamine-hydrolysing)
MNPRLTLALLAGRGAYWLTRRFGRGGGTVLPGHVIPHVDPRALRTLAARLPRGAVVVSGTNGKTTTTRMISQIATHSGLRPIHNRSGANLMTGIVSAIAARADLAGKPRGDLGIFEADEAHVPVAAEALRPRVLVLTNIFRDQLDRYGEVELIAQTWRRAVAALHPDATLILNADDPIVAQLGEGAPCGVMYFGVEDQSIGSPRVPHEADKRLCHRCGSRIKYTWSYYGHIGHYLCSNCGWRRPQPDVRITDATTRGDGGTDLVIEAEHDRIEVRVPLAGLYNAYNALAATTACRAVGIADEHIVAGLESFAAVFGRQERVKIGQGTIVLNLVKNPVGFNQVLQALFGSRSLFSPKSQASGPRSLFSPKSQVPGPRSLFSPESQASGPRSQDKPPGLGTWDLGPETLLVIAINDLFADGTDVSWLWDVDFEMLAGRKLRIICTGLRAYDMALRLKYAGIPDACVEVQADIEDAVDFAVRAASAGGNVIFCPTYTAMLDARSQLQRRGAVAPFWED